MTEDPLLRLVKQIEAEQGHLSVEVRRLLMEQRRALLINIHAIEECLQLPEEQRKVRLLAVEPSFLSQKRE